MFLAEDLRKSQESTFLQKERNAAYRSVAYENGEALTGRFDDVKLVEQSPC